MKPEEEIRRLREMCKKYLGWLNVEDVNAGLERDLRDPEMWSTTTENATLSCQSCRREHSTRSNTTCMACVRFDGERTDWHEQK